MSKPFDATPKGLLEIGPADWPAFVERLLRRVRAMKESTTYQAIKDEGRQEKRPAEARRLLRRIGEERFGTRPTPGQQAAIDAITDADRLEELVIRAIHVGTWADLLEETTPKRKKRK